MTDLDPRYTLPKRSLVGPALVVGAVIVSGLVAASKLLTASRAADATHRAAVQLEADREAMARAAAAAAARPAAAPIPDDGPAVFELVVGDRHTDLTASLFDLGDRSLVIRRTPTWTTSTDVMSVAHASDLQVVSLPDGLLLATTEATAELRLVTTTADVATTRAALLAAYQASDQVRSVTPSLVDLLGQRVTAERVQLERSSFEVMAARVDKRHLLQVILFRSSRDADVAALRDAIKDVQLAPRPPVATFDVKLRGPGGAALGSAVATLGQPVTIADATFTIDRRPTVRARIAGLTFEHAPALVAVSSGLPMPAVTLREDAIVIQLMASSLAFEPGDLAGALTDAGPVTHTFGGVNYQGIRGTMRLDDLTMETQLYVTPREGRTVVLTIQAPPGRTADALRLAETPIVTVH
ncbi:MAG: hypothetical protein R3B06_08085 [Kofleriaceae bacterium]